LGASIKFGDEACGDLWMGEEKRDFMSVAEDAGWVGAGGAPGREEAGCQLRRWVMTTNAEPKANGSRGLTLYRRLPRRRVNPRAAAAPRTTPAAMRTRPWEMTRRRRLDAPAAECHAESELAHALRNGVRHHGIKSDGGEQAAPIPPRTPSNVDGDALRGCGAVHLFLAR